MRIRRSTGMKPTERGRGAGTFGYFRRLLRHVWRQRRYLIPAVICIVVMAAGYSAGIGSLAPVMKVLLEDRSVPAWVRQSIAEQRLQVELNVFSRLDDPEAGVPVEYDYSARVAVRPRRGTVLREALKAGDLLVAVNGERVTADELFERVAGWGNGQSLALTVWGSGEAGVREVTCTPRPIGTVWRAARQAVAFLPQGESREDRLRTLTYILGVLVFISLVQNTARFAGEYLVALAAARTLVSLRRQMYRKVLRLPLSFFTQRGTSDLMSRFVQDSQDIYRGLTFLFVQSIREPLKAAGVFVVALFMAPRVTLFAVIVAPGAFVLIRYFGKVVRRANKRLLQGYARMLGGLEGALVGIRVVKGFTMEQFERRHLFGVDWVMLRQQLRIELIEALSSPLFEVLGFAAGAAATVWFYSEMLDERMSPTVLITMVVCLAAIFDPLRKLSNLYTRLQRANAGAERVFEIIDLPMEEEHQPGGLARLPPPEQSITFDRVTFTYPGSDRPAVRDFSLTVQKGERIALVGPNGSGKTTALALLARFFEPQSGRILFDGNDVAGHSLKSLREQISLVTQDTVVFAASVRYNIAYGDGRLLRRLIMRERHPQRRLPPLAEEKRIEQAARAAFADEFIRKLPQGYDTPIGEHGATLSGGQKQRIAIARAILRNAPILIFDEATSQIDADSENKIHRALEEFLVDRTGFIIAHRFSTILQADRIVVMDGGSIVDSGRHGELLERCPLYRTLFETQMQGVGAGQG